jgi:hypothetical protein
MLSHNTQQTPEVATGQSSLAAVQRYGGKRDVASMVQMSVRSVDTRLDPTGRVSRFNSGRERHGGARGRVRFHSFLI